jgi:hypothetical protein
MSLPEFVIAGIPLGVIIIALVEEVKAWGVTGKVLRLVSILLGVGFAIAFQLATKMPDTFMAWLTVVVIGLLYGIGASGGFDFLNKRLPARP